MAKQKPQRKPPAANSSQASSPKPSAPKANTDGLRRIDTTLAVEAAAAFISGRGGRGGHNAAKAAGKKRESLEFQLLKEEINEPGLQSLDNMLEQTDSTATKRSSLPTEHFKGNVGHNQTFGPDLTRSGVPRRTGG